MTAGCRPLANGAILRVAAEANVLRSGASLRRNALAKAGMVEALSSGKALRVAMGSAIQRAARRQRRAAVLGAVWIEIECGRGGREDNRTQCGNDQPGPHGTRIASARGD